MAYSSKTIEQAVEYLSKFPGIGSKSALRMVLYLAKRPEHEVFGMAEAIKSIKTKLQVCSECGNLSDSPLCSICASPARVKQLLCVVEDFKDVLAVENTAQFKGLYHVLGGLISPIDGVGPEDLNIPKLFERIKTNHINEVVFALSANMEGDTTTYYLSKKIKEMGIAVSTISRGISVGSDLEFTDEITLGRSIINRVPYEL
ncbi:MAG: recombination protein RecR [Bacteroidetes bacterium]|nr:recombination protein RecR [Bacteroidota bacterium]